MLKHLSLILLTLQNAILILVMRYTRTRKGDMYFATTAVVVSEALKVLTSLVILANQEKTITKLFCYLRDNIWRQPMDCLKVSVPSFIYTLQNNLLYIALSNLDAATFQVSFYVLNKRERISNKHNHFKWNITKINDKTSFPMLL